MEKIFKAKRVDNGEWVEFTLDEIGGSDTKGNLYVFHVDDHFDCQKELYKNTTCQYTCINDSEGNRIFEGDEAKDSNGNKCVVFFDQRMQQTCINYYDGSEFTARDYVLRRLTLTGHNIHDKGEADV